MMKRRLFLRQGMKYSLGFMALQTYVSGCSTTGSSDQVSSSSADLLHPGYGPLRADSAGIMELPEGFSYKIISRQGDPMVDGLLVPGAADGMATFPAPNGKVLIIRNHEVTPDNLAGGPFGKNLELLQKIDPDQLYDFGRGVLPCLGGTTTMLYNPATGKVEQEYLSLAGTIRNCAGGQTPWQSWITCEEDTRVANDQLEKNHGYNFEVPAQVTPQLFDPIPLEGMGRFNHEAVCVDPKTGIVYQTEDREDGLIYRYIPNIPGKLHEGGVLQVLCIKDRKSFDTRNWKNLSTEKMVIGQPYDVEWIDIDGIDAPEDDLRHRGFEKGAARFARGEGMWFGEGELYFACTNGGNLAVGQIFRYRPSPHEGQTNEIDEPGSLE
ncbi:MAG: PhoX family protein, partial [Saprospiraceae bacterium]|nr:PhoX family protein [Saprospiraceae bacterium]